MNRSKKFKIVLVVILIVGITALQYATEYREQRHHLFYEGLYFLPVTLGAFWFGLRGSWEVSLSITLLNLPYIIMHWQGFSADDFNNVTELVLYNAAAVVLGILKDREREEQRRAREVEGLAAMGIAVSGLAHDMKAPLIAIGGFTRLVKKHLAEDHPDHEKMDMIIAETLRMEKMIMEMLDFTRPLKLYRTQGDVQEVIRKALLVVGDRAEGKNLKIQRQSPGNLPLVSFDAVRLEQALINLLVNALEASPEMEIVTIAAYQRKKNLIIDVSDRGNGIPPGKRHEIFFPFFTTKKEGTGLGLPIAKKIVEAHRGRLEILDNPERGATFRVVLPIG